MATIPTEEGSAIKRPMDYFVALYEKYWGAQDRIDALEAKLDAINQKLLATSEPYPGSPARTITCILIPPDDSPHLAIYEAIHKTSDIDLGNGWLLRSTRGFK